MYGRACRDQRVAFIKVCVSSKLVCHNNQCAKEIVIDHRVSGELYIVDPEKSPYIRIFP